MDFDTDNFTPAAPALSQPYSSGLSQPVSAPTTLFGGGIPAVQFAPVSPIHAAAVTALHGPTFQPTYHNGTAHPVFEVGFIHAAVGSRFDRRG